MNIPSLILIATVVCVRLVPWKARNFDREGHYLSFGNVFSAGVFIGGGLLHLLPGTTMTTISTMTWMMDDG